jgi:3D (Asp-Asp-Asp) domain-containing protein
MSLLSISFLTLVVAGGSLASGDVVTAYCHCCKCTPGAKITASGLRPVEGTTIAGPRSIPLGTRVLVSGLGTFIVQDRLSERQEGRWDIYMTSHQRAKDFGKREFRVRILEPQRLGRR